MSKAVSFLGSNWRDHDSELYQSRNHGQKKGGSRGVVGVVGDKGGIEAAIVGAGGCSRLRCD